jgi:hypothetical protein
VKNPLVDAYTKSVQRMLGEDELRDALLLVFANKQVSWENMSCFQLKKDSDILVVPCLVYRIFPRACLLRN